MVGYDDNNNALTLGDDDALSVGDYDLEYNSSDDEWQAQYSRPIGGDSGNHGEINGAVYSKDSQIGSNSLEFNDPSNVYTTHRPPGGQNERTFAAWVKIDDAGRDNRFLYYGNDDTGQRWTIRSATGNAGVMRLEVAGGYIEGSTNIEDGSWHHVAVAFPSTGTNVTDAILYVDGSTETISASSDTTVNTVRSAVRIGAGRKGVTDQLTGNMDDVRFYDRELSSSEVNDLFNKVDITNGLQAYFNFEYPETPNVAIDSTGEAFPKNRIPRSTSGSLVPQGLAESVSEGKALADNGEMYDSVQTAIDNASGFVFVGPGTFNENVTITTQGLTLKGSGYDTLIDAPSSQAINPSATNVVVDGFRMTVPTGGSEIGVFLQTDDITIKNCYINDTGGDGISVGGDGCVVKNCIVDNAGRYGIVENGARGIITNCRVSSSGSNNIIIQSSDDSIVSNCIFKDSTDNGISVAQDDAIIIGNRVINSGDDGIKVGDISDCIVANNRISDSTNENIFDGGTGTVLDANLTGPSN